jgi:hypothetical protein
MVSTILVLSAAVLVLFLSWKILATGGSEIQRLGEWESRKHEVDVRVFRTLVDRNEERFLRGCLPPDQYRSVQRRRIKLALQMVQLVFENARMITRLAQVAKANYDPVLTPQADKLLAAALRLRLDLALATLSLSLKWLAPSLPLVVPAWGPRYRFVTSSLGRIQRLSWKTLGRC